MLYLNYMHLLKNNFNVVNQDECTVVYNSNLTSAI